MAEGGSKQTETGEGDWLAEHPSPADEGAETQSRFRYQHECTARSCIPLLAQGTDVVAVVCEEHEDFIVLYEGAAPELVSVKHREPSQGPWTFTTLCSDGGIQHLFDRWQGTGGQAACRLMTNAGLSPGADGAGAFANACHSQDTEALKPWISKLCVRLGLSNKNADVGEFAERLSIESGLPAREHIAASNLRDLVVPAIEALGLASSSAQLCYARLLEMIASANRDAVGDPVNLLDYAGDPRRFDPSTAASRRLRRREINRDRIKEILAPDTPRGVQLTPENPSTPPPSPSRLQQKLAQGGLGPTSIDTAVRLRASWYAIESANRASVPGGDPALEDLRLRVQELVAACEARADRSNSYGEAMYLDMRESVTTSALDNSVPFALDDKLLQGLVFQLTDECRVWWSEVFELDQ